MMKTTIIVINTNSMFLQSSFLYPMNTYYFIPGCFQLNVLCISELVSLNVQLQFVGLLKVQ